MSLNPTYIDAFDLPALWYQVLKACLEKGYERPVFRGERKEEKRRELDTVFLRVKMPSNRPLIPDVPEGVPPPTNEKYVNQYLGYLITPYKQISEDYTYGERIAGNQHIDRIEGQRISGMDFNQLDQVIKHLKETPETNRGFILVAKAEDLLLTHPPCLQYLQFKVRYNKLHLWTVFRSWDVWGGLPNNLAAFQKLKEYVAGKLGIQDGELLAMSAGLHLYSGQWELAQQVITSKSVKHTEAMIK